MSPWRRRCAEPAPVVETPAVSRYAHISVTAVVDRLLLTMLDMGASDLHLSTDCPPRVRVHGRMTLLPGAESRSEHVLLEQLFEITPERNRIEFETRQRHRLRPRDPGRFAVPREPLPGPARARAPSSGRFRSRS